MSPIIFLFIIKPKSYIPKRNFIKKSCFKIQRQLKNQMQSFKLKCQT